MKKTKNFKKFTKNLKAIILPKTAQKALDIAEAPFKNNQIFLTKIKLETCEFNVYHKKTL